MEMPARKFALELDLLIIYFPSDTYFSVKPLYYIANMFNLAQGICTTSKKLERLVEIHSTEIAFHPHLVIPMLCS
jgi:hypothetical protein